MCNGRADGNYEYSGNSSYFVTCSGGLAQCQACWPLSLEFSEPCNQCLYNKNGKQSFESLKQSFRYWSLLPWVQGHLSNASLLDNSESIRFKHDHLSQPQFWASIHLTRKIDQKIVPMQNIGLASSFYTYWLKLSHQALFNLKLSCQTFKCFDHDQETFL